MDRELFTHCMPLGVRHYEVDWQGIVHNVNYLLYFELGRVEYFRAIGSPFDVRAVNSDSKVVLVRNEVDYRSSALLSDTLDIRTRIREIRNTSFVMEGLISRSSDGIVIAENVAFHVWLDPATDKPTVVPGHFRELVRTYEKCSVSLAGRKD
jgi:acyl-CoA thioester hydrolase